MLPTFYDPCPAQRWSVACSLPIVTSTVGAAELVVEHEAGFVCPAADVDALARHMMTLTDAQARDVLNANAASDSPADTGIDDAATCFALRASSPRRTQRSQRRRPVQLGNARLTALGRLRYNRRHLVDAPAPHIASAPVSSSLLLYRRLLSYVRPYAWAFALAVVGMVIVAAGDVLMAYMVMPIIQKLQHPDPVTTLQLPLAVVSVFLLRGLGSFMSEYGMAWTGHRVVFDLRRQMIDRLLALPTPCTTRNRPGG